MLNGYQKNSKFDADFESLKKVAKRLMQKKLICEKVREKWSL
jgi:hypothetical protein